LTENRSAPSIWHQLEVVRERPHPVRNEVILRKSNIRITAGDHFRYIAMRDAEATRKVFDFVGKEGVGSGLTDQRFDRSAITGTSSGLNRVGLRNACAGSRYVCKCANAEGIAFAHEQRAPAIARKEPRLRLNRSKLTQCLQRGGAAHDDVGIEAGGAGELQREVTECDCPGPYSLNDDRLWQRDGHDIVEVQVSISGSCLAHEGNAPTISSLSSAIR
jgi:hypothetical protein